MILLLGACSYGRSNPRYTVARLSLSEKTVNIDGGAVIRCGNVENNASFSRLFAGLKEKLEFEVASYLFAETNSAE